MNKKERMKNKLWKKFCERTSDGSTLFWVRYKGFILVEDDFEFRCSCSRTRSSSRGSRSFAIVISGCYV